MLGVSRSYKRSTGSYRRQSISWAKTASFFLVAFILIIVAGIIEHSLIASVRHPQYGSFWISPLGIGVRLPFTDHMSLSFGSLKPGNVVVGPAYQAREQRNEFYFHSLERGSFGALDPVTRPQALYMVVATEKHSSIVTADGQLIDSESQSLIVDFFAQVRGDAPREYSAERETVLVIPVGIVGDFDFVVKQMPIKELDGLVLGRYWPPGPVSVDSWWGP